MVLGRRSPRITKVYNGMMLWFIVPSIKIKTPISIQSILLAFLLLAGCSGPDVRLFEADGTLIDNDIDKALEIYEKLVQEDYALSISVFTLRCPR